MPVHYELAPKRKSFIGSGLSLSNQLIIFNLIVYAVSLFLLGTLGEKFFVENLALTPALILQGKSLWTILTSMFMHGSIFHIFANMFSLFFVGNFLEKIIGKKRFFWLYLISGILGSLAFVVASFFMGDIGIPAVGASGAIFGLLGMLAVLVPFAKIYLIAGPLILIVLEVVLGIFVPTKLMIGLSMIINLLILVQIFAMLSFSPRLRKFAMPIELHMWLVPIIAIVPLALIGLFVSLPIGNSAHFGGLVVGLIYGFYLRKKFPRKTAWLSKKFS
jgi:uncharacterized protein